VAVLPISVAALMTPKWVAAHLDTRDGIDRVIVPGHCRGDLSAVAQRVGAPVDRGPEDLRDLPRAFQGERTDHRGLRPPRHRDPRRDQPRSSADDRRPDRAGRALPVGRGRRHRYRLRPLDSMDRRRRGGCGAQSTRLAGLDRQLRPGGGRAGRRGRGGAGPLRQCLEPAPCGRLGRRGRGCGDTGRARDAERPGRDDGVPRCARRPLPDRSRARSDRVRIRLVAGAVSRGAETVSRGRDDDGRRQSHGADGCRFRRCEHVADRLLPGAWDSERAHDRGDQLGQDVGPGDRPGPAADVPCRDASDAAEARGAGARRAPGQCGCRHLAGMLWRRSPRASRMATGGSSPRKEC